MEAFDVTDKNCWYFGPMSRQDATEVLMNERECGVFLVRDSKSSIGDYVLCVREDTKVSNYIINKIHQQDQTLYRIGDQEFHDLSRLLTFYTRHYLDTTPLRRPAVRRLEMVIGKFDFDSTDQDDLPFRRGEILTIIRKDEDQWWTAKNANGQIGQIPVPYVQKYDKFTEDQLNCTDASSGVNNLKTLCQSGVGGGGGGGGGGDMQQQQHILPAQQQSTTTTNLMGGGGLTNCQQQQQQISHSLKKTDLNRKLPAQARVKQARVPNAYDKTALKLEIGDIIIVTKTNINGQWEGELKGKKGHFPFTHVEFIDHNNINNSSSSSSTTAASAAAATTTSAAAAAAAAQTTNLDNLNNSSNTSINDEQQHLNMLGGVGVGGVGGGCGNSAETTNFHSNSNNCIANITKANPNSDWGE